jgi:PHD/YefM family antitoxin component YafN of YafNO toxin-antitoxin module
MASIQRIKPYEAKKAFTALLHKVAYKGRPVILESRGQDLAAIVPMEFLDRVFDRLSESEEDEEDWRLIQEALADPRNAKRIPWSEVRDELDRKHGINTTPRPRTRPRRRA